MNSFFTILKQEALGIVHLSLPTLVLAYISPELFSTWHGTMVCSLCTGFFIFYRNYDATCKQARALQFSPSEQNKEMFERIISSCKLNPATINLRYGYSHEGLAMAMLNTISIDPLIFRDLDNDPEAVKVKNILEQYTVPTMQELQKKRIDLTKQIASNSVLQFIFKHELSHVFYNYSLKKITLMALIIFIAAFSGISTAIFYFPRLGQAAMLLGMIVSGMVDLILSYASNYFFKAQAEKNADLFAAHYSSPEEIAAAADFFEKHQQIMDTNKEADNFLTKIPSVIATGHPAGKTRAQYLRNIIINKQKIVQAGF